MVYFNMTLYEKFRNSSLDISPVGLVCGQDTSDNVYTPSGARVIAWSTEQSQVHFCQVAGLGETVFAVDPAAPPGDCVHPVAHNITDFAALLCACRSAQIIAGAYQWSQHRFYRLIDDIKPGMKTRSVLKALGNIYQIKPIANPYEYITDIQKTFDYTTLPLHPDFFEWCPIRPGAPKWQVSPETDFGQYCDKKAAAKEHRTDRTFRWKDENWCVPAIYLSSDSIIVDSYLEVPVEILVEYDRKWADKTPDTLTVAQKLSRDLEDPLQLAAKGVLTVNNKAVQCHKTYLLRWNPLQDNHWSARRTLEHYNLDRSNGYLFRRDSFPRKGQHNTIRTIDFTLSADPVSIPGEPFTAPDIGKSLSFQHPETNIKHTLTVVSQVREALDPNFLSNHPCCYTRLHYTLTPPIHRNLFRVVDCDLGDPWNGSEQELQQSIPVEKVPAPGHCAISSLRYTPAKQIHWQMLFTQKNRDDVHVRLLP